ncbi:NAD(P)H-binding protein [Paracoccaceae bacterium]|nr:NAD(P)H-binding protein [Paracoccaceae bacterium]
MKDIKSDVSRPQKVLLAGATGYIGKYVCETLLNRGFEVLSLGRTTINNENDHNFEQISIDLCSDKEMVEFSQSGRQIDAVISCLGSRAGGRKDAWDVEFGANQNLLNLASTIGAKSFVLLSAICVQKPKLEFQFAKIAFENSLIASGINYSIIRPTAYFKSLAGQIENLKAGKAFVMFGKGVETACKPISAQDLSDYICDCVEDPERQNKVLPIGGPGPSINPTEQGEMLFRLLGKKPKFSRVPSTMFHVISTIMAPLALISEKISDLREFVLIGHYYATESMLFWDAKIQKYSSNKTPEYGSDTLESFYREVLKSGLDGHELGDQKLF